jgi:predicted TPR repeat methyltransferase
MADTFEQAKALFLRGLQYSEAGQYEDAEQQFEGSLALLPGRPSTLTNLGVARFRLGRHAEAVEPLQAAVRAQPDNVDAWAHLAMSLSELGRLEPALQAVDKALELAPQLGQGWGLKGNLLKDLGRPQEAIPAYEQALALGFMPELQRFYLAGLKGEDTPQAPPTDYVRLLFDGYAGDFEQHLVQVLKYRTPQLLVNGLTGRRYGNALDLGCGTGLCAPLLRPLCDRLEGIDLSANMVRQAQALGRYDEVLQGDLVEFLHTTDRRYDLLAAADVFVYVGALEAAFEGAVRVLRAGGVFCFSVEAADEQHDWRLLGSLRYAHSERYIRMLASRSGFELRPMARHPLRTDQGRPIEGLCAWLTLPG